MSQHNAACCMQCANAYQQSEWLLHCPTLCALIPLLLHLSSYTSEAQLNIDFREWPRSLARLLQPWCCPGTLGGLLRCFGFRQERSSVKLDASSEEPCHCQNWKLFYINYMFSGRWKLQGLYCYQFFDIKHSYQKASELCQRLEIHKFSKD
jgi:hypothetical protein